MTAIKGDQPYSAITDRRAFILENTQLQHPPHTPELRLHLERRAFNKTHSLRP
ncbi:MAG: hypothetical protein JO303_13870 [Caulobacteraceae bacterium]|nr:hypothetical protein [Caulobacteraceae bacterium]